MKEIVVVDKNWGIGKNNDLLFRLPADMKRFRETTTGKTVVMGGNTLLSLPNAQPLKNRTNILVSDKFTRDDMISVDSLDGLSEVLTEFNSDDVYVMGGAMLYRSLLPYCDTVLVTKVDADGGAEVFFKNLDESPDWSVAEEGEPFEDNGHTIKFMTYKNSSPKKL